MKKLFIYFLIFSVSLAAHDDIQRVLDEVSKAKPTPKENSVSRVEYDQKIQKIAEGLAQTIHHFENTQDFIRDATGSIYPQFTIRPLNDDLFHGLMGSEVYLVSSPQGAPVGILKVYQHDFRQFAEEVWAIVHLKKIHCSTLRPPRLYGIGSTTRNGHQVLMTFQEYATGESLDELMRNYLRTKEGFGKLCKAYFLMGVALAELHQSNRGPNAPLHPIFEDSAKYFYSAGKKILKANPEYAVEIKTFKRAFKTRFSKIREKPQRFCYTHFDVHGGNYKVNLPDLQVWILDLEPAAYSIASHGEPIGVAALDYVQAIEYLKSYKIWGLSRDDYTDIRNAF